MKSPRTLSNLIKGGAHRQVPRTSFPTNASLEATATPSSFANYAMGNVKGPVVGFDYSSDTDAPLLKGGRQMSPTKKTWRTLVLSERSASGASVERAVENRRREKIGKKKKKRSKKSLFGNKLSNVLNAFSRYGGQYRRKETAKFTKGKESKTDVPGFSLLRSDSQVRLGEKNGDRDKRWLSWGARREAGFTDDKKTRGWTHVDSGDGQREKDKGRSRKIRPLPSEEDFSLEVPSDRWEDWTTSSSCEAKFTSRRR